NIAPSIMPSARLQSHRGRSQAAYTQNLQVKTAASLLSKRDQSTAIPRKSVRSQRLTCCVDSTGGAQHVPAWVSGLVGIVAFAAMSVSASAAPIGSMTGLATSEALSVTKVAGRQHRGSQAHKARQGRSYYGAAGLDDPPADNWHD